MKKFFFLTLLLGITILNAEKLFCTPMGFQLHNTNQFVNGSEQEAVNGSFSLIRDSNKLTTIKNTNRERTVFKYTRTSQGTKLYCNSHNICMHVHNTGKSSPSVVSYMELYLDNQPKALVSYCK